MYLYYQNPKSTTHSKIDINACTNTYNILTHDLWNHVNENNPCALNGLRAKVFINVLDYATRLYKEQEAYDFLNALYRYIDDNKAKVYKDKNAKIINRFIALVALFLGGRNLVKICNMYLWLESKGLLSRHSSI